MCCMVGFAAAAAATVIVVVVLIPPRINLHEHFAIAVGMAMWRINF